jgi:hypothetical protein
LTRFKGSGVAGRGEEGENGVDNDEDGLAGMVGMIGAGEGCKANGGGTIIELEFCEILKAVNEF